MFDTIAGLPIHPLTVHAVVVLLPLMAIATVAVAVRPAWRGYARWVLAGNVVVLVAAVVARQSGLALYERIGKLGANELAETHAAYGKVLPLFALFLVAAAAVLVLLKDRPQLATLGIVVAVVAALLAIGWTVVTGDSGARAVWQDLVTNTN
ncbi:DUF2231 domain-containing protein [Kineosporia sp. A_224]|uniref:DUF2231 domain-containing protein n=1 Tax=Kineosporia sp. A_224 TaxID=1962180 RepID=UPI000B4B9E4F|nr:DUF2231 domain-containing protein [Kineosporia sp. A_224]